jgi:hypothetical protein
MAKDHASTIFRFGAHKEYQYVTRMREQGLKLHMISIDRRREFKSSPTGDKNANYKVSVYCPTCCSMHKGVGTPKRALITAWKDFLNCNKGENNESP